MYIREEQFQRFVSTLAWWQMIISAGQEPIDEVLLSIVVCLMQVKT